MQVQENTLLRVTSSQIFRGKANKVRKSEGTKKLKIGMVSFLPRDAGHKRGLCYYAVSVCVSVCLSVCLSRS